MKKILSLVLVTVMVMSLSIPAFADKPTWAGNNKDEAIEETLPKGLQKKDVIPYGHRKDQEVSEEEMEELIEAVEAYIENLDLDSDDDGLEDANEAVELIDLSEAEDIALDEKDGAIVKMSFDDEEYEFEIWFDDELFEIKVDAVDGDFEIESDDDEEYDLDDVISYEKAKSEALDEVNKADAMVTEVELDMDEDEELEATYEVKVMTDEFTYEIKLDAFNGDVIDFDSEEIDEDSFRDLDRDRDRDYDGESMVSAIQNLIDRIEFELEKDEPELGHFMFQLENKFSVLQKKYGEAPEKEDYTEDLEELKEMLDDVKDDSVFDTSDEEAIQDIIDEIEMALEELEDEEVVSEEEYEAFEERAEKYFDMLDEVVELEEVEELIEEIRNFVFENDFGNELGEYNQNEAMALLGLVIEAPSIDDEDLEEYYDDLKLAYKKFKMSKLVAGDYLDTLKEYKEDLEGLSDAELTEAEEDLRDDLIDSITTIEENEKMTLDTFYKIEEETLDLLEDESVEYEEELDELIDEVKEAFLTSFDDVDQDELRDEKNLLLSEYFVALAARDEAETENDFEEILIDLQDAYDDFNAFLEQ